MKPSTISVINLAVHHETSNAHLQVANYVKNKK